LEKLSSTKYPLYLVLMELAHQLRKRRCLLDVAWRPREENEEADALTNWQYGAFDVAKRIPVVWEQLPLEVLPRLASAAEAHFEEVQELKRCQKGKGKPKVVNKMQKLKETDPL
jgi:hypothetical protein